MIQTRGPATFAHRSCQGVCQGRTTLRSAGGSPKKGVPHTPLPPTPTWKKWGFCLAPGKPLFPGILFLQHDSCISHWAQFLRASSLAPGNPARGKQSMWGQLVELTVFQETETSVLVSCGFCDKVQRTGRPKTTGFMLLQFRQPQGQN